LTPVDHAVHRWYMRELAKRLDLSVADLHVNKASGESLCMRAQRLVAQREAKKVLEAAAKEKRRISDGEVESVLQKWSFARNVTRQNVIPDGQDWVFSDTLGLLRDRVGDIHLTTPTCMYPDVTRVLCRWLTDRLPADCADFTFTSINLNYSYAARLHRDGNNFGPSFIAAFGDFTGGELNYYPEDNRVLKVTDFEKLSDKHHKQLSLRENGRSNLALFNGNCAHSVAPFEGSRYSIVYFTCGCFADACEQDRNAMLDLCMPYTPAGADRYKFLRAPNGFDGEPLIAKGSRGGVQRSHGLFKPTSWESKKFAAPTPQKLTGCAEQIRIWVEKGKGVGALRHNDCRLSEKEKQEKKEKKESREKEKAAKLMLSKGGLKRPASSL